MVSDRGYQCLFTFNFVVVFSSTFFRRRGARKCKPMWILAHRCPSPPIGNISQIFLCSVHNYFWRRVHRCAISITGVLVRWFCSVRLAYCYANCLIIFLNKAETEIDWWWQNWKTNRHRSPQSEIIFEQLLASLPSSFFITHTTFKQHIMLNREKRFMTNGWRHAEGGWADGILTFDYLFIVLPDMHFR